MMNKKKRELKEELEKWKKVKEEEMYGNERARLSVSRRK